LGFLALGFFFLIFASHDIPSLVAGYRTNICRGWEPCYQLPILLGNASCLGPERLGTKQQTRQSPGFKQVWGAIDLAQPKK
jgi:hypothetical protein